MGRFINTLVADGGSRSPQITDELVPSSPDPSSRSICSPQSINNHVAAGPRSQNILPARMASRSTTASPAAQVSYSIGQKETDRMAMEGPSSLSAHSTMAIDFLDKVAGADRSSGYNIETRELLDSLRQIVHAIKTQSSFAEGLFLFARPSAPLKPHSSTMPPIEAVVAAIRRAEGKSSHVPH